MTQAINARLSLTLLFLIVAYRAPAAAQTAGSFEELALLVESGDRITVTNSAGSEQTGRIVDLSPSTLELLVDGARRDFREAQVHTIRQWRHDSLRNGMLLGLFIGAVVGGRADNPSAPGLIPGLYAAAGMGIGAGIDALIPSRQVIYQSTGASRRVTVAPVFADRGRGVAVSLGF